MKKTIIILLALLLIQQEANAKYKINTYTGKYDYYESGVVNTSSGFLHSNGGSVTATNMADDQIFVATGVTTGAAKTLPDCDDSVGQHLNYDQTTNAFSCGTSSSAANGWSYSSPNITLSTSTDNVGIGGSPLAKLSVTTTDDETVFLVRFDDTQSALAVVYELSDGTDVYTWAKDGTYTQAGTATPAMSLGGGTPATYPITFSLSGSNDPVLTAIDGGWKWAATSEDLSGVFTSNTLTYSSSTSLDKISYGAIKLASTSNMPGNPKHLRFTIMQPLEAQTEDNEICIVPATDAAITISKIEVTLDSSSNQIAGDFKFADTFIGLANATVIEAFDTTSGVLSDASISGDATVPAGKCLYISFDSAPNTAIKQANFDITYSYD